MLGAFGSPTLMKPLLALPLLVSSVPLQTISLLSGFSINPTKYKIFNDSEEFLESKRVTLQQPPSSCPITLPS